MHQGKSGRSKYNASAIGVRCMSMSGVHGSAEDGESIAVIQAVMPPSAGPAERYPEPQMKNMHP